MKNSLLIFLAVFYLAIFTSCEEDNTPEIELSCAPSTDYYGSFILNHYSSNPIQSEFRNPTKQEAICWDENYPIQVAGTGTGNCGQGYEMFENPFLGTGISVQKYKFIEPDFAAFERYLTILGVFSCGEFSTRESFYNQIQEGQYGFAANYEDFGKFIVEFWEDDILYSSINLPDQTSSALITEVQYLDNQGTAFVEATILFNAVLLGENGKYIHVKDAEVKGRFFRTNPWGYNWED